MGKRKEVYERSGESEVSAEVNKEEEDEEAEEVQPKKRTPKKQKFAEPFVDELGWSVVPPSLIWRDFGDVKPSTKIAAFDLDGTLVNRKSNSQFARASDDWRWWNKGVPDKLAELVGDGFKVVIFSNQGSIKGALGGKAKAKVEEMLALIHTDAEQRARQRIPLQVFLAPSTAEGDPCRKPQPGMWQHLVAHCNGGQQPDLNKSFFVGDADGSVGAHSDADSGFAAAVGVKFFTPTAYFGEAEGKAQIDRDALVAARAGVEDGSNPNAHLITQLKELAEATTKVGKATGDDKAPFKARALRTAADALGTFASHITEANLKEVGKLKGVGKGTLAKIQQYLKTGNILSEEEQDKLAEFFGEGKLPTPQGAPPAAAQPAFAFM